MLARAGLQRLAAEKAEASAALAAKTPDLAPFITLAADTVVAVGAANIAQMREPSTEAEACLSLSFGAGALVCTGIALVNAGGGLRRRLVETRVRFKRLLSEEIGAESRAANGAARRADTQFRASPAVSSPGSSAPIPASSACRSRKRRR